MYATLKDDVHYTIFIVVDTKCNVVAIDKGDIQRKEICSLSEGFTQTRHEMKSNVDLAKRNLYL